MLFNQTEEIKVERIKIAESVNGYTIYKDKDKPEFFVVNPNNKATIFHDYTKAWGNFAYNSSQVFFKGNKNG